MARLPQPGGDSGQWGSILNDFLAQAHNSNGTLKDGAVTSGVLAAGAVTMSALNGTGAYDGDILVADSNSESGYSWMAGGPGGVNVVTMQGDVIGQSDANVISDGAVSTAKIADGAVTTAKLAAGSVTNGILATGSVDATILSVTGGAPAANDVLTWDGASLSWSAPTTGGTGATSVSGDVSGTITGTDIPTTIANNAVTTAKLNDNSVTAAKLANSAVDTAAILDNNVTEAKLNIANTPATNQLLSWNGTTMAWVNSSVATARLDDLSNVSVPAPTNGQVLSYDTASSTWISSTVTSTVVTDATTSVKGIVQLAGDLSGTAAAPTVPALANKVDSTRQVATSGSLTGGGNLTADRTLSLVNDSAAPGNSMYYGTSSTGTKGYFALPTGSGGGATSLTGDVTGTLSGSAINTTISSNAVTTAKIQNGAVTPAKISSTGATSGQVLSFNGTNVAWTTPGSGGGGGIAWNARHVTTANSPVAAANGDWILANPDTATIRVDLPAPTANAVVRIKRKVGSGNSITVASPNGGTIDAGEPTSTTVNGGFACVEYQADGSNWWAVGAF